MSEQTKCFTCDKTIDLLDGHSRLPSGGTVFDATGNYGSTVFDPMCGDTSLTIVICDDCLVQRAIHVQYVTVKTTHDYDVRPWKPSE